METATESNDRMVRKIRGLMDKAAATSNQAEKDTFLAGAARLAAKHAVTDAMLADAAPVETAEAGKEVIAVPERYSKLHAQLVSNIATGLKMGAVMHPRPGYNSKGYASVTVVGFPSEIAAVKALYLSLGPVLAAEFNRKGSVSFKMNIAMAFIAKVRARLLEEMASAVSEAEAESAAESTAEAESAAESTAEAATKSVALVMADRTAKTQSKFKELFPSTQSVGTRMSYSHAGRSRGERLGSNVDLNTRSRLGR